jgi:hypothetical protein
MRTETIRTEVQRLIHQAPFQRFALNMEKGDHIVIEHPENIAFDPPNDHTDGSNDFYVISSNLRVFGTFDAVSTIALVDSGS